MNLRLMSARAAFAGAVAAWLTVLTPVSLHADEGWVITSFRAEIQVAKDSTITVTEDIRVDFQGLQKHGIFRTIPLRYRYDDTHDRYYELTVRSVTDGGSPLNYDAYVDSDNQVIKIGDPHLLVTGRQHYIITYSVRGAMNAFAEHDELFWNVDGDLWPVVKRDVTATV